MELHAFPQMEGVSSAILGYFVLFSDGRGQISVCSGLHQPLEHIEHDFSGSCLHGFVRVKTVVKILCDTNNQFVGICPALLRLRCAAVSASAEYGAQEGHQKNERQKFLLHVAFSFTSLPYRPSAAEGQCGLWGHDRNFGSIQLSS